MGLQVRAFKKIVTNENQDTNTTEDEEVCILNKYPSSN